MLLVGMIIRLFSPFASYFVERNRYDISDLGKVIN